MRYKDVAGDPVLFSIAVASLVSLTFWVYRKYSIGRIWKLFSRKDPSELHQGLHLVNEEDENGDFDVDVIAVHGLNADSRYTWTASVKPNGPRRISQNLRNEKVNWIDNFLRKDIPKARILTFNYYSSYFTLSTSDSAFNIGTKLLDRLVERRAKEKSKRPIFFIGHSFGGIVINKALATAADRHEDPKYADIRESTAGAIYLGTPFDGSPPSFLGAIFCDILAIFGPDSRLLRTLSPHSDELEELRERFRALYLGRRSFRHFCFYEALQSSFLGVKITIVSKNSASLDGNFTLSESLDKDHSGLNKFASEDDPSYVRVRDKLEQMIEDSGEETKLNRKATRLKALFTPPSRVVRNYVERHQNGNLLMIMISTHLTNFDTGGISPNVAVLIGMGGSGKTQLALQYCQQSILESSAKNIFWVNASSAMSVASDFEEAARNITGDMESGPEFCGTTLTGIMPEENRPSRERLVRQSVETVVHYLETHGPWLMVFDGYDQPDRFSSFGKFQSIRDYWPKKTCGEILITSRNRDCQNLGNVIEVGRMSEDEAIDLLRRRATLKNDSEYALIHVVKSLGCLALAIAQAGAYIYAQELSAAQFLDHFQHRKKAILERIPKTVDWEYSRPGDDRDVAASVFTTWDMSLDCLSGDSQEKLHKVHFLSLAGCLHPTQLHEDIFRHNVLKSTEFPPWAATFCTDGVWDGYLFGDLLAELRTLSLLEDFDNTTSRTFSIHPLVSDWIKLRMSPVVKEERILEAGWIVRHSMPGSITESYDGKTEDELISLSKHATTLVRNCQEYLKTSEEVFRKAPPFGRDFAWFLLHFQLCSPAEVIYQAILATREESDQPWRREDLESAHQLCWVYASTGRIQNAIALAKKVECISRRTFGAEDYLTLKSQTRLGDMLMTGRYLEEAGKTLRNAYEAHKRVRGEGSFQTMSCRISLASFCAEMGRYEEALPHFLESLDQMRSRLPYGPEHRLTLQTEASLLMLYNSSNMLEEGLRLGIGCLGRFQRRFGHSHPETIFIQLKIAVLHQKNGNAIEALRIMREGRERSSKLFGYPLAKIHGELAVLADEFGDHESAKSDYQTAVEIFHENGDFLSQQSILSSYLYSCCYKRDGDFQSGESLLLKVLQSYEKSQVSDYVIEHRLYWGLYFHLVPGVFPRDPSRKSDVTQWLDKGLHASYQMRMIRSDTIMYARAAVRGYIKLGEPGKQDIATMLLLFAWEKEKKYQDCQSSFDMEEYRIAVETPLPSLIETICGSLIEFRHKYDFRSFGIGVLCMHYGDLENATVGFEKGLQNRVPYPFVFCDACGESVSGSFSICKLCPLILLHPPCYETYQQKGTTFTCDGSQPSGCSNHEFLEINRSDWVDNSNYEVVTKGATTVTFEDWLGEMKIKYGQKEIPKNWVYFLALLADYF